MASPLDGIRVLDFGRYIAGPYCASLLAEYGADVIRVEKRTGGEDRYITPVSEGGEGALFLQMNRNKRSITVDPKTLCGQDVVRRLVASADIVVANLPQAELEKMGLDYPNLTAIRADIILVVANGFGAAGPLRDAIAFDAVGQAMSGAVALTGSPTQPYRSAVSWVDFSTALHAAFATMIAVMERARTGQGQQVTTSLLANAVTLTNALLIEQAVTGADRKRQGNRSYGSAPTDIYAARDGWLLTQVIGQPSFSRWATLMGEPGWLSDPRFASDQSRGDHSLLISDRMALWCAGRSCKDALLELGAAKIPAAPVLDPQAVLDHPQVASLGILQQLEYPGLPKPAPVARAPITFSGLEAANLVRAPTLGEHTDEILVELGFTLSDIGMMRAIAAI